MMRDRIMALLALACFVIFFAIVARKVGAVDLAIASLIGVALVIFDLWTQLGPGRRRKP